MVELFQLPLDIFYRVEKYLTLVEFLNLECSTTEIPVHKQTVYFNYYSERALLDVETATLDILYCLIGSDLMNFKRLVSALSIDIVNLEELLEYSLVSTEQYHREFAKYLICECAVDPSVGEDLAIRVAAEHGDDEMVELLLQDNRVQPNSNDDYAIYYAAANGHYKVVDLLLRDKRVDPQASFVAACANGHTNIVERLLDDERLNERSARGLQMAHKNGHFDIVDLLVKDGKSVDFGFQAM
ncbi:hypothetical protein HK103_003105 [Boothiomyces macroporosus]|uniref:Ankyrin repeat protein n=1 Tax=Boothiomyces macroporosus TaxID=261099 RepID=A0AAD5ULX8_9FUNG|nr:hypothetical protein HK103_003105 [Boothiomyces macroporosus]